MDDVYTDLEALKQRAEMLDGQSFEELKKAIHELATEWLAVDDEG